jgi:ribonuclease BN (tRNA processing enzyme)
VDVAPTKSGPTQEVIDFVKTPSIEKLALICDCYSMAGHRMTIRDKVGGEFISTPYSSPLTVSELIKRAGVNQAWLIHPSAQLKRIKFDDMLLEVKKRVGDSIQVSMPKDGEEVEF